MNPQLLKLSLAEWRHHPGRHAVALLAVALGVALAGSVQIINESALAEFSQALRSVNGQPDAVLVSDASEGFDDALYARLALDESVAVVSPVLSLRRAAKGVPGPSGAASANPAGGPGAVSGQASANPTTAPAPNQSPSIQPPAPLVLRVMGIDAFKVAATSPDLMPRPTAGPAQAGTPASLIDPASVFLNPAALTALGLKPGATLALQSAGGWQAFTVAGTVAAGGAPLAVIDIAAAQARMGLARRLSRLDIGLHPGTHLAGWQAAVVRSAPLPPGVRWAAADDAVQRVSNLSRAYRVNLGVLALVALLVGGFLVYSVVSLSVAQRTPSLALLGVLGLAARDRRWLVLIESGIVGALGSALGLGAGAALAALALRWMGGDLGGGYFAGGAPQQVWPLPALAGCALLGWASAVLGAWWPARQAERLSPALALKGLGGLNTGRAPIWPGMALLALGGLLALLPPVAGLPLAAYAAVAALLAGGVMLVPAVVQILLRAPKVAASPPHPTPGAASGLLARFRSQPQQAITLLALRRARFASQTASASVAGVVASLALSVAITVMVASFRGAVIDWLDSVLPADLYLRGQAGAGSGLGSAGDAVFLPPTFVARAASLPGVARLASSRQMPLTINPQQPAVALLTRELGDDPAAVLPLLGAALPEARRATGVTGVFVSEPAAAIYGWQVGDVIRLPIPLAQLTGTAAAGVQVQVRGIWRDYARQFGAIAISSADYTRLTGDRRINDLALWLQPGANAAEVEADLRRAAGPDLGIEMASTRSLRQTSLRIFDRSFAVTFYLQAVAIGVGLVGVAASLSAQVLARRKEFGLLAHLGLTRGQVIALVGAEASAWLLAGTLIGLALGLAMALVLVKVVNPQSFHWTMPLQVPLMRLAALAGAVLAAGLVTALWSARRAAGHSAVMAVKEDW